MCASCTEWKCCPCHLSYAFSTYTAKVIATFLLCMPVSTEKIPGDRTVCKKVEGVHQWYDSTSGLFSQGSCDCMTSLYLCFFHLFISHFQLCFVYETFSEVMFDLCRKKKSHSYGPSEICYQPENGLQYPRLSGCIAFSFYLAEIFILIIWSFGILSVLKASIMMHFND